MMLHRDDDDPDSAHNDASLATAPLGNEGPKRCLAPSRTGGVALCGPSGSACPVLSATLPGLGLLCHSSLARSELHLLCARKPAGALRGIRALQSGLTSRSWLALVLANMSGECPVMDRKGKPPEEPRASMLEEMHGSLIRTVHSISKALGLPCPVPEQLHPREKAARDLQPGELLAVLPRVGVVDRNRLSQPDSPPPRPFLWDGGVGRTAARWGGRG
eukprot:scaffold38_cov415-Prasinococcus_capsulatus_cf.AAC.16